MKKKEILKLIEASKIINKNKELLSMIRKNVNLFPNIEELKQEFDILGKEVDEALNETDICKKIIQNSGCNHEVRLKHYGLYSYHSKCVLCGNSVTSDNCVNFGYSINRNKYCVKLVAKYQDDEDYGPFYDGYTNEHVYKIIINILKNKEDDEEVDLVQEFKKLNLLNCEINEERKVNENFILIIGGSNKQYIDNDSYLYKKSLKNGLDFVEYFDGLLNTKIELIDNRKTFTSEDLKKYFPEKNYNLKFTNYDTTDDLEKTLLQQKQIPFKVIIDLSEIYEYKVNNNTFSKEVYNLKLNEYFPDAYIIRINDLSKKSLEELSISLKDNNKSYGYQSNKYYYIEDNDIKSENLEDTCNKIKKLLKNKGGINYEK